MTCEQVQTHTGLAMPTPTSLCAQVRRRGSWLLRCMEVHALLLHVRRGQGSLPSGRWHVRMGAENCWHGGMGKSDQEDGHRGADRRHAIGVLCCRGCALPSVSLFSRRRCAYSAARVPAPAQLAPKAEATDTGKPVPWFANARQRPFQPQELRMSSQGQRGQRSGSPAPPQVLKWTARCGSSSIPVVCPAGRPAAADAVATGSPGPRVPSAAAAGTWRALPTCPRPQMPSCAQTQYG